MAEQRVMSADEQAAAAAENSGKGTGFGDMPEGQKEANGKLSNLAPGKVLDKAKKEEEEEEKEEEKEEEEEEEEEDEEKMEKMKNKACKKSESDEVISEDNLIKALDALEAAANGIGGETDRRTELAEGLVNATLSKSEQAELIELLGGSEAIDDDDEIEKSFSEQFANDEKINEVADVDVSGFIEHQSQLMAKALDGLSERITKSFDNQGTFNKALAKSFRQIGEVVNGQQDLIKSLSDRLGTVESTPLPRKSRSGMTATPLSKSVQGEVGSGDGMSRDQIMGGLTSMVQKSYQGGGNGLAPCGEDLTVATSMYESSGHISRSLYMDVAKELGKNVQVS